VSRASRNPKRRNETGKFEPPKPRCCIIEYSIMRISGRVLPPRDQYAARCDTTTKLTRRRKPERRELATKAQAVGGRVQRLVVLQLMRWNCRCCATKVLADEPESDRRRNPKPAREPKRCTTQKPKVTREQPSRATHKTKTPHQRRQV
jgi:hypothetical protein